MLISQPYRSTVKRLHMKNINITKSQAITVIKNILNEGSCIPMASLGYGGDGFGFVWPNADNNYEEIVAWLNGMGAFRIVPSSEISDEFSDVSLGQYDLCVEFTSGDYSEQYLLWDINYYKD